MRKPEQHTEIVLVCIPVLAELMAVMFTVGVACIGVMIYATRVPT